MRQFKNINNGEPYPYKYDRRHEFAIVCNYEINKKILFSSNWIFSTGNALTLAQQKYNIIDYKYWGDNFFDTWSNEAHYYGGRNSFRAPSYHRLDIGITFIKEKRKGMRQFYFGVYNLYNHKNPYYYYFDNIGGEKKLFRYTLFPIIPSFSYTFKFN